MKILNTIDHNNLHLHFDFEIKAGCKLYVFKEMFSKLFTVTVSVLRGSRNQFWISLYVLSGNYHVPDTYGKSNDGKIKMIL